MSFFFLWNTTLFSVKFFILVKTDFFLKGALTAFKKKIHGSGRKLPTGGQLKFLQFFYKLQNIYETIYIWYLLINSVRCNSYHRHIQHFLKFSSSTTLFYFQQGFFYNIPLMVIGWSAWAYRYSRITLRQYAR